MSRSVPGKRSKATQREEQAAARVIAGESITAVARELGVSRRQVHRDLKTTTARNLLGAAFHARAERIGSLIDDSLEAIEDALDAKRVLVDGDGKALDEEHWPPDHQIRLAAVRRLLDLVDIAAKYEPEPEGDETGRVTIDYDQLQAAIASRKDARPN